MTCVVHLSHDSGRRARIGRSSPRAAAWGGHGLVLFVLGGMTACLVSAARADTPLRVLLLDGANPYHEWRVTTPVLVDILRASGRFVVDVSTVPEAAAALEAYRPRFDDYDVVLSNFNAQTWPEEVKSSFDRYLSEGGGFVCVHAASNAFADWPAYNAMCGLGGWYGRDETWGPYVYYRQGQLVRDESAGPTGSHGPQHEFLIHVRNTEHPITQGLPETWMHARDELYDRLRGPAKNMEVLATAYSSPKLDGTGRDEPTLMVVEYGKGRVFHTTLGHADYSMRCVGFIATLLRGTEWAATGKVTIPVPDDFPTAERSRSR